MKLAPVATIALAGCLLAGCQHRLSLDEARALCTKQGGFLVIIHTQKVTSAGVGQDTPSPGNCISPSKFDAAPTK